MSLEIHLILFIAFLSIKKYNVLLPQIDHVQCDPVTTQLKYFFTILKICLIHKITT